MSPPRGGAGGLVALYAIAGAMSLGIGAVFALLAELQDRHGLPTWGLGLISASAFVAALVMQLTVARYADRGRAGRLLRLGVGAAAAGLFWTGFATELWQFVAARAVLGMGTGMFLPAARRIVIVVDPARQAERLGVLYGAFLGGFVFGPRRGGLAAWTDLGVPFVVLGLVILAALALVARVPVPEATQAPTERAVLRGLLRERRIVAAILVVISFRFSIGVFEPIWARFLTDLGAGTFLIGLSLTLFAAPMILVARFGGRLSDRHGARLTSLVMAAATVPFMASYGLTAALWLVILLAIVHGLFEAIETPGSQAAIADAAPEAHQASAQGLGEAAGSAAAAIGALGAAPVYDWLGPRAMWLVSAGVMAVCLSLSTAIDRPTLRRPRAGEPQRAGGAVA